MFLQRQGQTSSKTSLFTLSFSECVETLCFAMFFQQGALNVPQILGFSMVFFIFLFPVLKASQPKTLVFTVSWKDHMQKKHGVLKHFFMTKPYETQFWIVDKHLEKIGRDLRFGFCWIYCPPFCPLLSYPAYTFIHPPFRRDDSVINMFVVMIIIIGIVLFIRIVFGWSESESRKAWPPIQVQSSASLLKVGSSVKVIHVLICFCHAYPKAVTAVPTCKFITRTSDQQAASSLPASPWSLCYSAALCHSILRWNILLVEEFLYHLGCTKPCKECEYSPYPLVQNFHQQ